MKTQTILLLVALVAIGQSYAATTTESADTSAAPETTTAPSTAAPTTAAPTTAAPTTSTPDAGNDTTTVEANTTTTSTTTKAPTTTTTTPKPTPPPTTVYTWKVKGDDDKTCIMLKTGATMAFDYTNDKNKTITKNINLPNATATGVCNTSITLTFNTNWTLEFHFMRTEKDYMVKQVDLTFFTSKAVFPGILSEENVHASRTNVSLFQAPIGQSYKCNKQPDFNVTSTDVIEIVKINTTGLQIEAFRTDTKEDFGTAFDCDEDTTVNNLVPIVVGAALAGLVLIVLIAYLIGRRKSRRGYESV